jgi:hypothetical protein
MEQELARLWLDVDLIKGRAKATKLELVVHLLSMVQIELVEKLDRTEAETSKIKSDS